MRFLAPGGVVFLMARLMHSSVSEVVPSTHVAEDALPQLLVAIHDTSPLFDVKIDQLVGLVERATGPARYAMLVVPNHWGEAPLAGNRAFGNKLRAWADAGVEIFLHGWLHRDDSVHVGRVAAFKARHMTAREGEFLGLSATEAERRICEGRDLIEQIIGRPITGFVAPAWLYGDGAREALAALDIPLAEDHLRVWRPRSGEVLARGPVITWASRTPARTASSLMVAAAARVLPAPWPVMRVAVHPGDVTKPSLIASIERTLRTLASRRSIGRYADLLAAATPEAAR